MKFKKTSKITVAMMLVLTLALTVGATSIGAYAAPSNQNQTVTARISNLVIREGGV